MEYLDNLLNKIQTEIINYKSLIENNANEISFIFNGIFLNIAENFKQIKTYYNTDLVQNIITRGIPATTSKILTKGKGNI